MAPCELCPTGILGQVSINGTTYALSENASLPSIGQPIVYGYRLMKGDGKTYDVGSDGCDCPDCTFRSRKCKHLLALEWLVAQGTLAPISE